MLSDGLLGGQDVHLAIKHAMPSHSLHVTPSMQAKAHDPSSCAADRALRTGEETLTSMRAQAHAHSTHHNLVPCIGGSIELIVSTPQVLNNA